MIPIVAFAIAAVLCLGAFLGCYLTDNPHMIPELPRFSWSVPEAVPAVAAPAAPAVYRDASGRWRDATTRRFAKAPV